MSKIIDCGTCDHGLLTSPKMITCCRGWPWKDHRRSFGEYCFDWRKRKEGKIYYDYDNPDEKSFSWETVIPNAAIRESFLSILEGGTA